MSVPNIGCSQSGIAVGYLVREERILSQVLCPETFDSGAVCRPPIDRHPNLCSFTVKVCANGSLGGVILFERLREGFCYAVFWGAGEALN